jgi:hypothetical protein
MGPVVQMCRSFIHPWVARQGHERLLSNSATVGLISFVVHVVLDRFERRPQFEDE